MPSKVTGRSASSLNTLIVLTRRLYLGERFSIRGLEAHAHTNKEKIMKNFETIETPTALLNIYC